MNCAVERHNCGSVKMKTLSYVKNSYQKEQDFDKIVDQLCTRLQDIKDCDRTTGVGMHIRGYEETEAVKRYCAAFPALKKGKELPMQYYLPPPEWCRKNQVNSIKMQAEIALSKDYSHKTKKLQSGNMRRNTYNGPRKGNKKRCHGYGKTGEDKDELPEWVTHEGEWDMETQDPVKEFIRALALDEGYGTNENTVTEEPLAKAQAPAVPDFDDGLDLRADWPLADDLEPRKLTPMEEEMYAKFEAKFDRSIEALWAVDTPDDECQELPIDFHDLLSSPSDNLFLHAAAEAEPAPAAEPLWRAESPGAALQALRLDERREPFSLYSYEGIHEAVPSVADVMRSLTALNHSKGSRFAEVLPRPPGLCAKEPKAPAAPAPPAPVSAADDDDPRDDPLTSERTHFRPIRKEAEADPPPRHRDGDTFDIRGDLDPVAFERSESGSLYLEDEDGERRRYLEYRTRSIDYGRLNLTDALREANEFEDSSGLRLRFAADHIEVGVQTEAPPEEEARAAWDACADCARGAKKMRPAGDAGGGGGGGIESLWSSERACGGRAAAEGAAAAAQEELAQEWEELLADIAAAHAQYATEAQAAPAADCDRKRRRPRPRPRASCSHPHAPFLLCIGAHRPLTR